jgi:OFA family oxalate/formate antiporter-like MFS transporter
VQTEVQGDQGRRILPRVFYGWYIVSAGMGIHLWISIVWIYGMQVFFTPIVDTFGWSRAAVSGAFGLQRLEGSVVAPVEGFLIDRIGPRKMIMAGSFITGLGLISLSFLSTIWMFYLSVLLVSLGVSAASGTPRNWAIVQWFRRLRGRALGIGASGAVASGPMLFIVVWLVETLGWRASFLVLGIATWFILIPLGLVFRSRPREYGLLPDGDPPDEAASETALGSVPSRGRLAEVQESESLTVIQALKTPAFWTLSMIFGAQTMGVSGLMVHLIPYLQTIGFSTAEAASVLAFFTVLSVFGRLGGGWIMDYVDPRFVLAGLLGCLAAGFILLANITAYWQVVPFALLYGTAFGGMLPARSLLVSNYFGTQNFGALQGLTRSVTVVAGVVSPVLLGLVFDLTESYVLAFYILTVVAAAAIPLALMARPPKMPVQTT